MNMASSEDRNILRIGPGAYWFQGEITPAMVRAGVRAYQRRRWRPHAVGSHERRQYQTLHGDGLFFHLSGIALNETDANRLVTLASAVKDYRWHIRTYQIGLIDGVPALLDPWPSNEEFAVNDVVEVLAEIPPDGTVSRVLTDSAGWGARPGRTCWRCLHSPIAGSSACPLCPLCGGGVQRHHGRTAGAVCGAAFGLVRQRGHHSRSASPSPAQASVARADRHPARRHGSRTGGGSAPHRPPVRPRLLHRGRLRSCGGSRASASRLIPRRFRYSP